MLNPTICPQCLQPNEPARAICWKCMRPLAGLPTESDYLRFFELKPVWTPPELKAVYLRLAKKYHPDVNVGDREAEAYFKFVNRGYEVLSRLGQKKPAVKVEPAPTPEPPAPEKWPEKGSDELYEKLAAVVEWNKMQKTKKPEPKGFKKFTIWLRGVINGKKTA